jgi:hypothetical protein
MIIFSVSVFSTFMLDQTFYKISIKIENLNKKYSLQIVYNYNTLFLSDCPR